MLQGLIQIALTLLLVLIVIPIFGGYIARVFLGERTYLDRILTPVEWAIYQLSGIRSQVEMTGWQYIWAVLTSNFLMAVFVFMIFMLQGMLPLNPTGLSAPSWDLALHTAISFVTNTNQQHYAGEVTITDILQQYK